MKRLKKPENPSTQWIDRSGIPKLSTVEFRIDQVSKRIRCDPGPRGKQLV